MYSKLIVRRTTNSNPAGLHRPAGELRNGGKENEPIRKCENVKMKQR